MPTQCATTSTAPDARFRTFCTALSCPPLPKKRVIDLPFEEEGDSALLPQIMSGMTVSIRRSIVPPVYISVHAPPPAPAHSSPYFSAPSGPVAPGVVIPAQTPAQVMLSRHIQADASSAQRRQSPSPPRAIRHDREGRRSSSRLSTMSSFEDISDSATTRKAFNTRRRTSDSSLSSSSNHSTQPRY